LNQLFYAPRVEAGFAFLEEEESRHLMTVLRRKVGDLIDITDGKGFFYVAELADFGKKTVTARIISQKPDEQKTNFLHIAIAPTKQMERFEWFLEKVTEIGVAQITPLLCKRSERKEIRQDRLEKIAVSAMKQSLRGHLPVINALTPFATFVKKATEPQKFIAWCDYGSDAQFKDLLVANSNALILIGPEGDFSPEEVKLALEQQYLAVGLGAARLRTETAGVMAAAIGQINLKS
jgi:16S rRNA (uracil1498-N3)-methyltransferase